MADTLIAVAIIVLLFIGVPVIILRVRDRVTRAGAASRHAAHAAERQAYEQRIVRPDWTSVEQCLQRHVPQALRDLYSERALVTTRDREYSDACSISTFEALDEQGITEGSRYLGFAAVVFATTDTGDSIYLRPGLSEPDRVYLTHHDGGDTEVLATTMDEMLERLKQ